MERKDILQFKEKSNVNTSPLQVPLAVGFIGYALNSHFEEKYFGLKIVAHLCFAIPISVPLFGYGGIALFHNVI